MAEKEHKPAIFPRRCPECGKTEVYRETINYVGKIDRDLKKAGGVTQ